ncbi:MAG: hypothetical protein IRZ19_04200 [Pyrinomonas methylaliphatogenes]|jgi:hypothetical protein|nr:hypothetical protein [Pyrinomonas methylaliphatogenes]
MKNKSAARTLLFSVAIGLAFVFTSVDLVWAQESQGQSGAAPSAQQNSNRRRSRNRARRNADQEMSGESSEQGQSQQMSGQAAQAGEQTDLSGTYTGTVNFPDGGLSGEATLTIQGNNFTLTSGGTTRTGRLTAVTTRGYTAVTMQFEGAATGGQTTPMIISLRARRNGDQLTLTSVRGETRQFSFVSGGTEQARRGRGRRGRAAKPAESATPATPAEPGQQSATPAEQATPAQPEQGRATRRNQRRNQRRNANRNANANANTPTP